MRTGVLTISLDFELYWGTRDVLSLDAHRAHLEGGRRAVPRLLSLFTEFGIHATWAVVGLSALRNADEASAFLPARRPGYVQRELDPYPTLAHETLGREQYFFARELVELIAKTPHQEVGTHTFSHYYCLEAGQTRDDFLADLQAARAVNEHVTGQAPRSLVFPRNQFNGAFLEACRAAQIRAYRGNQLHPLYAATAYETPLRRAGRLLDAYVNVSGHHGHEVRGGGTEPVDVPASRFLRPWSRRLRLLEPLRLRRIRRDLEVCAARRLVYHLWWHPENFGTSTEENLTFLRGVLERFRTLQTSRGMRSLSMDEVAEEAS